VVASSRHIFRRFPHRPMAAGSRPRKAGRGTEALKERNKELASVAGSCPRNSRMNLFFAKAALPWLALSAKLRQVPREGIPVVGDCPDFRAGLAERKWDCPLHAFRLQSVYRGMLFSGTCLNSRCSPAAQVLARTIRVRRALKQHNRIGSRLE
jgi:hypothetical protein